MAPRAIVRGALSAVKTGVPVVLVGDEHQLKGVVPRGCSVEIVHAGDAIAMDEKATAIRRKKDSSLYRTLELVRDKEASAAVSCGHTGALLVGSVLLLGIMEGVERPAIATVFPRRDGGRLVMLDAGANIDCRPEQLACFALLGTAYAQVLGTNRPRVGLLSNGEEREKGNLLARAALPLLEELPIHFVGYVEATTAMDGACDVLVCDGFIGNLLLKAAEGATTTVVQLLKEEIGRHPTALLGAWLLRGAFRRFRRRVEWDAHGGALLLGTKGLVVVGHGRANAAAVKSAVCVAHRAAEGRLVECVSQQLQAGGG
ncbi:MAG: phosphate acyltransferase PlsX [Proteobacteria bacterium]|nr:phosphate acyltransferase PlsX [Pseudomonadota bacterium]